MGEPASPAEASFLNLTWIASVCLCMCVSVCVSVCDCVCVLNTSRTGLETVLKLTFDPEHLYEWF